MKSLILLLASFPCIAQINFTGSAGNSTASVQSYSLTKSPTDPNSISETIYALRITFSNRDVRANYLLVSMEVDTNDGKRHSLIRLVQAAPNSPQITIEWKLNQSEPISIGHLGISAVYTQPSDVIK